jgi:hypothetical protein
LIALTSASGNNSTSVIDALASHLVNHGALLSSNSYRAYQSPRKDEFG